MMRTANITQITFFSLVCLLTVSSIATAHESIHHRDNPRGVEMLHWSADNISRVVSAGYPASFGVYAFSHRRPTKYLDRKDNSGENHSCLQSNFLAFDVDDDYAYNINETITLELLIDLTKTPSLVYGFDQHGSEKANGLINVEGGIDSDNSDDKQSNLVWRKIKLDKARFVNRGISNTDFVLTTSETMLYPDSLAENIETTFVLCDMKISRTKAITKAAETKTNIHFSFVDNNQKTPVRVGLYDSKGSAVLINKSLNLKFYEDNNQQLSLPAYYPPYQYWPHNNRYYYYINGEFSQKLPPDTYTLIASKGPEYRMQKHSFSVNEHDQSIEINMKRWLDLPALGWYSGDVHIHIEREQQENNHISAILAAEDVHFSNLLEMSTNELDHFQQYAFGEEGTFVKDDFAIIPGVEGPRTAHRGHTIALNVQKKFMNKDSFFLYHKYFKHYQQQNSVIGYAHVGSKEFNASLGLALDMPFGLVDFVEIMQNQQLRTEFWYEFLNLGFKLAPAAGSDYPYFEQPGAVRSYVKMSHIFNLEHSNDIVSSKNISKPKLKLQNFDTKNWFEQLRQGHTFVSNAPYIDLLINGQPIGSKITLANNNLLTINAKVAINTDFDKLAELELIHCGEVIKQITAPENGSKELSFEHQFNTKNSGWLALRAKGKNYALAHTGAIYLQDEKGSSVCRNKAPAIINTMLNRLSILENSTVDVNKELEYWQTKTLIQDYSRQKPALVKQIVEARKFYKQLKNQITSH